MNRPPAPVRSARPAAPGAPPPPPEESAAEEYAADADSEAQSTAADEDVMLAVPPAPPEHIAQIVHYESPGIRKRLPSMKSAEVRQTFIPPLLTVGAILWIAGVTRFLVGEDSPLHDAPAWLAPSLFALGGVFLAIAGLNMMQLRAILNKHAEGAG